MPSRPQMLFRASFIPVLVGAALFSTGCRTMPGRLFRRPEDLKREEIIDRLHEHAPVFTTLTDARVSLRITQEMEAGRERYPSVGGVLAFDKTLPGLWLRAERFGQNIFTLRAHENSFWLEIPDSAEIITGSEAAYERMPHLVRPREVLLWFASPEWLGLDWDTTSMETTRNEYVFEVTLGGFPLRRISVDRYDLNINSIMTYDIFGTVDTSVTLDRYRRLNGRVFPHRLSVYRPQSGYTITLQLGQPRFNRELPVQTFLPRRRPGWNHIDLDRQSPYDIRGPEGI